MQKELNSKSFFMSVEPMEEHKLRITTQRGDVILFDFTPCLMNTRFADLKDEALFSSAETDGAKIVFQIPGVMPIIISASDFLELLTKKPSAQ